MKLYKILILLITLLIIGAITSLFIYNSNIQAVSSESKEVEFSVETGSSFSTLATSLKENNLIKSEFFYKIYVRLNNPTNLQAGPYLLNENMSVEQIIDTLSQGNTYNPDAITITFKEGLHMRSIAEIIEQNTNNTYDSVFTLLEDEEYLDTLIENYWFLTDEIKNEEIYYSLEGYLFPSTYQFANDDVTVQEIFKVMLDQTSKNLENVKEQIESTEYTFHEMLTMASIVELEAAASDDRAGVAGVFYNRLEDNWSLGSDVTTYYAEKIEMSDRDLYRSEIDEVNAYNTRPSAMAGKLPVGPICNPGLDAILASINPTDHDNYYFVADKNKETYFMKTYSEHLAKVAELKEAGLWYEYN